LILDGAIGSYLEMKYPKYNDDDIWMSKINIEQKEILFNLHKEYVDAGADVITSNTFSTHPYCFIRTSQRHNSTEFIKEEDVKINALNKSKELVNEAISICQKVKDNSNRPIFIAGSNSPAEFCYSNKRTLSIGELEFNHINHINYLNQSGCDFILNETFSHFDEIKIVLNHCSSNLIPYTISLFFTGDLKILSGENVIDIIKFIDENYDPIFISVNCVNKEAFYKFMEYSESEIVVKSINFGYYLNCGSKCHENKNEKSIDLENIDIIIKYSIEKLSNLFIIGTCCMSDPSYTKCISDYFINNNYK
jgi:S-methylmethionine-dependent homocysteine/selenocysteine methylase